MDIQKLIDKCLKQEHPVTFQSYTKIPLKIGIHRDIHKAHPEFSIRQIRLYLRAYVKKKDYMRSIARDQTRHDLNGKAVEEITQKQKEIACERLGIEYVKPRLMGAMYQINMERINIKPKFKKPKTKLQVDLI